MHNQHQINILLLTFYNNYLYFKGGNIIIELDKNLLYPGEIPVDVTDIQVPGVKPNYIVTNFGRVYSKWKGKFKTLSLLETGYYAVMLQLRDGKVKYMRVNRLVILSFKYFPGCEDITKYICNHIDGNKLNNHINNLEWTSYSDNMYHAYSTGLIDVGENNHVAKLTNNEVIKICELIEQGEYTYEEIANIVGGASNKYNIRAIKQGESWSHISKDYNFNRKQPSRLFTDQQIKNICSYFQNCAIYPNNISKHCKFALEYFGYPTDPKYIDTIRKIYYGKYYKNISSQYNFVSIKNGNCQ